ncbi:MAG: hypothetical protein PHG91_07605 [Syntrophales bacterium]|nr:hypothetical protein [Syntrophales bacterium]
MKGLAISLILLLASLPIISWGFAWGRPLVWQAGLAIFAIGALIPPAARLFSKDEK